MSARSTHTDSAELRTERLLIAARYRAAAVANPVLTYLIDMGLHEVGTIVRQGAAEASDREGSRS